MICEIEIQNFRSIRSDKVSLEPLTVLIGANGSGKSNLVKALEFISELPKYGLNLAVSRQGSRDAIVSKNISLRDISKNPLRFKYKVQLPPPILADESSAPLNIEVDHDFEITFRNNRSVHVDREQLVFHKALYVGQVFNDYKHAHQISKRSPYHYSKSSSFSITHSGNVDSADYQSTPEINQDNLNAYLAWLGLDMLKENITDTDKLTPILDQLRKGRNRRLNRKVSNGNGLFIDPEIGTICDFSPQSQRFISKIESIKRYDLLLNELRQEQSPSDSPSLSKTGENMPTILRKLKSNKKGYQRLNSSFEAIAPHISSMKPSSLRTGKEFIEFIENENGRGIESWETSDGSLRALAILVALETAEANNTIIIEEPEQNLHPWAIRILIDHIREVMKEKSIQIILTTHSEHVLSRLNQEEVRVVTRDFDNGTKFRRLDQILPKKEIEMGEIGRLWVKGLLGGVPTA